ncbi:methyltransferase domain-containing protein [Bacillus tianshenii]|nr:methyltransferase domain-containing protein [Bacillus tianshenii]
MRKMTGEEFDQLVDFFDGMVQTSWLGGIHQELKQVSGSWGGLCVLDVGCGTGRLLMRGAEEAEKLSGIDLSEGMVNSAREVMAAVAEKADLCVGDACQLPYEDEAFDLSFATCVLFLLPDPTEAMVEMLRVTKSGGRIFTLNPSVYLTEELADEMCKKGDFGEFEEQTLRQWAKVSERRHRYDEEDLKKLWLKLGAKDVTNQLVYHNIGIVTEVHV